MLARVADLFIELALIAPNGQLPPKRFQKVPTQLSLYVGSQIHETVFVFAQRLHRRRIMSHRLIIWKQHTRLND